MKDGEALGGAKPAAALTALTPPRSRPGEQPAARGFQREDPTHPNTSLAALPDTSVSGRPHFFLPQGKVKMTHPIIHSFIHFPEKRGNPEPRRAGAGAEAPELLRGPRRRHALPARGRGVVAGCGRFVCSLAGRLLRKVSRKIRD
ncbi:hypothetical protein VULLAG_LOCUS22415 [Vulpes lagopus]